MSAYLTRSHPSHEGYLQERVWFRQVMQADAMIALRHGVHTHDEPSTPEQHLEHALGLIRAALQLPAILFDGDHLASSNLLFEGTKNILGNAQAKKMSVQETWKALWNFFVNAMGSNYYLRQKHNGNVVAAAWRSLNVDGKKDFEAKYFDFDEKARKEWGQKPLSTTLADSSLSQEVDIFMRHFVFLTNLFSDHVVQAGFIEACSNTDTWASKVTDRKELEDEDCPICFLPFQPEDELPLDTEEPKAVSMKMPCGHLVCSPCLRDWASSGWDNRTKCPTCRAYMPPSNPQEKKEDLLQVNISDIMELDDDEEAAKSTVEAIEKYFATLPASIKTTPPQKAIEAYNLYCWSRNIFEMKPEEVSESLFGLISDLPVSGTDEEIAEAALYCFHLIHERLKAFLEGDQDRYRTACTSGLYAHAHLSNALFIQDMMDEVESYQFWLAMWQQQQQQQHGESDAGNDTESGLESVDERDVAASEDELRAQPNWVEDAQRRC